MKFKEIKLNDKFTYQGNLWQKVTSRTALLLEFKRVFYFGMNDNCYIIKIDKRVKKELRAKK